MKQSRREGLFLFYENYVNNDVINYELAVYCLTKARSFGGRCLFATAAARPKRPPTAAVICFTHISNDLHSCALHISVFYVEGQNILSSCLKLLIRCLFLAFFVKCMLLQPTHIAV
jgi:hypothetical protein